MSTTLTVATQADLLLALANAKGGETIQLAPGDYGDLELAARTNINLTYAANVTILSADSADPAVFTGLNMRGVSNLTFDGVIFDYRASEGAPIWTKPFQMTDSANITIRNSVFDGDLARGVDAHSDGYATGVGLSVRNSNGITVENNEVSAFARGFVFDGADDLTVAGNDIHSVRIDGMNFSSVQKAVIENNHIHDFIGSPGAGDHCDMIQFWTNGTTRPSTDILIHNNFLDVGAGDATQSIFMRNDVVDRGLAGSEMFYRNITITENVIVNGHSHGITVGETAGLVISSNSVLHGTGGRIEGPVSDVEIPRINVSAASTEVEIARNATSAVNGYDAQSGWTVHKNAYVQDQNPLAPGWYGDAFITSSLDGTSGAHHYFALPGGMVDTLGAGAPATLTAAAEAGPRFHVTGPLFSNHVQTFDAGVMGAQPEGTTYLWDFGDGTIATGPLATHAFATGGRHDVTLSLRGADGRLSSFTLPLPVADAEFLRLDAEGFSVFMGGEEHVLDPSPALGTEGLQLGAEGIAATVARTHVMPLLSSLDASIAMTLTADAAGATGEVVRLHGTLIVSVNSTGAVEVVAWSDTGQQVKLIAVGAKVNDTHSHEIDLRLSDGQLTLWVDGAQTASTDFAGTFAADGTHDLAFGNPWGKPNFKGELEAFSINLTGDAGLVAVPPSEPEPALLRLDISGGFEVFSEGETTLLDPSDTSGAEGLRLGAPGVSASVSRDHITPLFGAVEASVALTLTADTLGTVGEVARLHNAFVITVVKEGHVIVQATSATGQVVKFASNDVAVNDTARHEVELRLSGGRLDLWVDGDFAAGARFDGGFADVGRHDLTFGNPWGKANFDGDLGAFTIRLDANAQTPQAAYADDPMLAGPSLLPTLDDSLTSEDGTVADQSFESALDASMDLFSMAYGPFADPPLL